MKRSVLAMFIVLLAACGGESGDAPRARRIVEPGSVFSGQVNGRARYIFEDESKIDVVVTGMAHVTTPEGAALSRAFPASVSFAVRAANGEEFAERVDFDRVAMAGAVFRGEQAVDLGTAVLAGAFMAVTGGTVLDLQGFSYPIATTSAVRADLVLQGARLTETQFEAAP